MTFTNTSEQLFHSAVLSLAAIVYGITAWNSHGFFYPDEHYQILEFAGLKLGINEPWNLSWEYHEKIRSSVQPALAYVIIQLCNYLGLNDIYNQVVVLRLLTAVLALVSVSFFVKTVLTNNYIKQSQLYIFFSYFLLFIPFLSVRFAAETWGGLLLLIPTALLLQKNKPNPLIIGLLFGLSFVFRFQMAIAIVGILLWLYVIRKENLNYLSKICISGLLVVSLATCIDAWFYGEFVFAPWRYFSATLFENDLPRFHETAFYRYPIDIMIAFTPLLGLFVLIGAGYFFLKQNKNIITWIIIPFLLVHSLVPHKEIRFLIPVLFYVPLIVCVFIDKINELNSIKLGDIGKWIGQLLLVVFLTVNAYVIYGNSIKAAGRSKIGMAHFIHNNYKDKKINIIHTIHANPYQPWGADVRFYLDTNYITHQVNTICDIDRSYLVDSLHNIFVIRQSDLELYPSCLIHLEALNLKLEKQLFTAPLLAIHPYYQLFESDKNLILYSWNE
jgi:phosphatidylinositol glycan class B